MQTALLFTLGLGSVLVGLAAIVTVMALRRAPEGVETEEGFQMTGAAVRPVVAKAGDGFSGAGALCAQ